MKFESDLQFLSSYRQTFMGVAIFWVFFYHTGVSILGLRELFSVGWIGVEIFFLVSGFGLSQSLSKDANLLRFYKRRFVRIVPTWLAILILMHVVGYLAGFNVPKTIGEYIEWYTGMGWWLSGMFYEWYIPTLMAFYIIAPFLHKLSDKSLIVLIVSSIIGGILLHEFRLLEHVYMSYQRIPIFILGFLLYRLSKKEVKLNFGYAIPIVLLALFVFGFSYVFKNSDLILSLEMRRYAMVVLVVPMLWSFSKILNVVPKLKNPMNFLGILSMEIYLLHIGHSQSVLVCDFISSYASPSFTKIIYFGVIVLAAWLVHTLMEFIKIRVSA